MSVINKLCSRDLCTGCFACKQVCAKGAIHIVEKDSFFLYPEIDTSLCVGCSLCTKVCPVLNMNQVTAAINKEESVSYAIWNNNMKDRVNSSSGGVFSAMADRIIKDGGIVYGAAWDDAMRLSHVGVDDIGELDTLRRSKYVQSSTDGTFNEVKVQLKKGRKVLFCGTPCQVAGLLSFLGKKDYPNLLTVGVICHGVPSQKSFDKYIREIEDEKQVKVYDCNFRSKQFGWCTGLNLLIYGKNKKGRVVVINRMFSKNSYFNAFLKKYFLRESCYNCPYKEDNNSWNADIMLSDAWSLWPAVPWGSVDYRKGVSAVSVNTNKGGVFLRLCADSFTIMERPYSEYASNSGLSSAQKPNNNDQAFDYLKSHSWMETQAKFFPLAFKQKLPIYTRLVLGENAAILIKRILRYFFRIHR